MATSGWSREQLLVALHLYCQIPFGKISHRNPEIVKWAKLIGRTPSALSMKMGNIASLDPAITSTGRSGLENASATDKAMWEEMQSDWERFALDAEQATVAFGGQPPEPVTVIGEPEDFAGAERPIETRARVGQNFFRNAVLSAYDNRCCITGLAMPSLLVASHIVPWRVDPSNRLNPRNGLSLSALHDRAFDAGIITISEQLTVRISRSYSPTNDEFFRSALLAYDRKPIARPAKFAPDESFLDYHRQHVFKG